MPRGKGATFGFIGSGEVKTRATNAILDDQFEAADGNVRFILPITKDHWNDGIQLAADFAIKNDIPFEIVIDDSTAKMKDVKEYVNEAVKEHKVARIPHKIVALLEKATNGKLVVFWDDPEDEGAVAFAKAHEVDIPAFDIVNGFEPLTYGDDEDEKPKPDEPDDEPKADVEDDPDEKPNADDEEEYQGESASEQRAKKVYTRKQLEKMDLRELKILAEDREIEIPPRSRVPTYITALLAWQEEKAPKGADPETGEVVHDDDDDEHVDLPEDDEGQTVVPSAEDGEQMRSAFSTPQLVGSCAGCGGPIFAVGEQPKVKWNHAEYCILDNEDANERYYDARK